MTERITSGQKDRIGGFGAISSRNLTKDEAQRVITHPDCQKRFDALVNDLATEQLSGDRRTIATVERRIKLTLDYGVSPADTLRATKCDYIYEWMLTHHPEWKAAGTIEVEVCLIDMGRDYPTDESKLAIDELGLSQAPDNMALWTLFRTNPDLQREIGIMDPGTEWRDGLGSPCLACLQGLVARRHANLGRVACRWPRRCRVLALSK